MPASLDRTCSKRLAARPRRAWRRCFTLIELLVVVALIALLVSLLLVALGVVQSKARETRTLATLEAFSNACTAFQQEHGFYPGAVPSTILANDPKITSTQNAILHLMGGYVREEDVGTAGFNDLGRYPQPTDPGGVDGWTEINFSTPAGGSYAIKVNPSRLGEGPIINGKSFPAYFTPGESEFAVARSVGFSGAATVPLPDLLDAWGQPIIYLRQQRTTGSLTPTSGGGAAQFDPRPMTKYTGSRELGRLGQNQIDATILPRDQSIDNVRNANLGKIIGHPALSQFANGAYTGQARGAYVLISAGADGVYFAATDGAGTPAEPVDDIATDTSVYTNDAKIVGEYDDVIVFGGG
jgi:prepilin-type N-terminal cleavage/methylation domain-containing protein